MAPRSIPITEKPLIKRDLDKISLKEMPRELRYRYLFGPFARWTFWILIIIIDFLAVPSLFLYFIAVVLYYLPYFTSKPAVIDYYFAVLYIFTLIPLIILELRLYSSKLSRSREEDLIAEFFLGDEKKTKSPENDDL